MALLATIRHGPLLPTDDHGHDARSKLFCDASTYALTEEEAREVIGSSDAAFRLYLKGLLLAGTFKLRCDLPVTSRAHFQTMVFNVACWHVRMPAPIFSKYAHNLHNLHNVHNLHLPYKCCWFTSTGSKRTAKPSTSSCWARHPHSSRPLVLESSFLQRKAVPGGS